ncbi:MAG TPA: SDR family NAD(P)-dependent oxidoreductase [Solirubrobacteraceae bacterium]|nr:SDR family NAD(P)-dependent oxidoreductase [Solirubrobacteraceae bacterium]
MKLDGRTVVITGAAGGIGRALALRCAAAGARVAATDIQAGPLSRVGDELGEGHLAIACVVTDERALDGLLSSVESELGPVEVFFANAGVAIGEDPIDTPDDVWDLAFSVNIRAHVFAARRLLPGWLERGEGYFVTTASAAGLLTQIGSAPYAVTKHAAVAFAEWLSVTYGDRGIRVSCLCPMGVRTAMTAGDELAHRVVRSAGAMLEPEEVADVVVEAIDGERFLILPHPEVLTFFQRKAMDYDRWLAGMRRLQSGQS